MAEEHDRSMMENLYWWGIPTLFRCPNLPVEGQDIALVGVPHSTGNGTTERDQHLGPRAVRNVSAVARRVLRNSIRSIPSCSPPPATAATGPAPARPVPWLGSLGRG